MAKGKKTDFGKIAVGLAIAFLLFALIPLKAWLVIGVVGVVVLALHMYNKSSKGRQVVQEDADGFLVGNVASASPPARLKQQERPPLDFIGKNVPVSVGAKQDSESSFRVPTAPSGFGQARWIPTGEVIAVSGAAVPGGLIYVGTSLKTPNGGNDPCLIDPSKSVSARGDYTQRDMGYWPSYSDISSSARRAYLNWLVDGRKDPNADIGFVFLFFYGLERRAILDAASDEAARADAPVIAAELRRLLGIYGDKSNSFRHYASSLLDWVSLASHPEKAYLKPVPVFHRGTELPIYVRVALGQAAVDKVPVPAELALAWAKLDPMSSLRTPATRCAEEFDNLFIQRYRETFGEGLVLPKNRTKIKLVHRPASAGFRGYNDPKLTFGETPDVSALTAPIKRLQLVVEAVTTELEPFSRAVGKNPEAKSSLEALLQLPATLWPQTAQLALQKLKSRMGGGMVSMSFQDLLASLEAKTTLTREKSMALARALESVNIGIEPDVLGGAKLPKPDEPVVLFAVPPGEAVSRSTSTYQAAALTLQLASAVATADGEYTVKEIGHLRTQVQSWTHLTPNQIRRLLAHLRLLMTAPVSLTTLKKKLEPLDSSAKETIAVFMASVAQSDGTVSPAEVKILEKVYKALGVDSKKVFSDVHAAAAGAASGAAAPASYATKPEETGFRLDPARIAALQKDTEAVSAMLAGIFKEEEPPVAAVVSDEPEAEAEPQPKGLLGLDEAHSALARLLLSRPQWTKDELSDAAADLDLMPDGAMEALNEAAFDKHDLSFSEGDDPLIVNPELLEKLAA